MNANYRDDGRAWRQFGRFRSLMPAGVLLAVLGLLAATLPATASAEDWEWEFISPQRSGGQNVQSGWGAANGENAFYQYDVLPIATEFANRTPFTWDSISVPQQNPDVGTAFVDASPDMSRVITTDQAAAKAGDTRYKEGLYLHEGGRTIVLGAWDDYSGAPWGFQEPVSYLGGSEDKSIIYVNAIAGQVDAPATPTELYRWEDGEYEPVELDDPRYLSCQNNKQVMPAGMEITGQLVIQRRQVSLMQTGISADGRTLVVKNRGCSDGTDFHPSHLYLIREGETAIDITKPLAGDDLASVFVGMTPDASRIFLTSTARLTPDDNDTHTDLYMWEGEALTRISADPIVKDNRPLVTSAIASPDGSAVWFVARSIDAPQSYTLFAWQDGVVRKVVDLGTNLTFRGQEDINPSQLSYDGSALLQMANPTVFGTPPAGPQQIYRVTLDGEVDCVSCTADGDPTSGAVLSSTSFGFNKSPWPDPRISSDGSIITFESPAALVPEDTNDAVDVYVWNDGKHELISTGTIGSDAIASGMSWDGRTVYFRSWGAFMPGSSDPYLKMYAARRGGGFPSAPAQGACGADCQGPITKAPGLPRIDTVGLIGDGNVAEPRRAVLRVRAPKRARGAAVRVRARVSGPGRIVVNSRALRRSARAVPRAGAYNLRVALRPQARRRLVRNKTLRVQARVLYRARGGGQIARRVAITFHLPQRAARKGGR